MGKLIKNREGDAVMADKSLAVMKRHKWWYQVEEFIPFSFLSNKVDMVMKSYMAARTLTFTSLEKFDLGKAELLVTKPNTKLHALQHHEG